MTQLLAQTRLKSFDIPHKGLRNLMAQVNFLAGNTDFTNPEQVSRLHQLGNDLFQLLREHAHDENDVVLSALERRQPGSARQNSMEHEIIENEQEQLEALLDTLTEKASRGEDTRSVAEQFYFALNHFQSGYLLHMLEEESETQRLLWKFFSDAELLDMRRKIIARMSPESQLKWYRYSAPAMDHTGRLMWLRAVKAAAPEAFFGQIIQTLEEVLAVADMQRLKQALSEQSL